MQEAAAGLSSCLQMKVCSTKLTNAHRGNVTPIKTRTHINLICPQVKGVNADVKHAGAHSERLRLVVRPPARLEAVSQR